MLKHLGCMTIANKLVCEDNYFRFSLSFFANKFHYKLVLKLLFFPKKHAVYRFWQRYAKICSITQLKNKKSQNLSFCKNQQIVILHLYIIQTIHFIYYLKIGIYIHLIFHQFTSESDC